MRFLFCSKSLKSHSNEEERLVWTWSYILAAQENSQHSKCDRLHSVAFTYMSENEIYVQPKAMAIAAPQTSWSIDSLQALNTGYEEVLTSYIALCHLYFGKGPDTKYKVACGRTQVGGASKLWLFINERYSPIVVVLAIHLNRTQNF